MKGVVTLFHVRGIAVRIHASWLVVFALISWSLSAGYLPEAEPGLSATTYWIEGLAGAFLLFVSVFFHELAHAVVAGRMGIPVSSITLHVFGGVSQMTREPERPGAEALVAIAGPAASLALAAISALVQRLAPASPLVTPVARYLLLMNATVGLFNLAPGFPLDGGRLLRAALWKFGGDPARATRQASRAGEAFAAFLMAVGIFRALGGQFLGGLWLVLIGVFLRQAAEGQSQQLWIQRALELHTVAEGMTRNPIAVQQTLSCDEAIDQFFWPHHVSSFPVLDGARVVGIVSLDRLKPLDRKRWTETKVADVMYPINDGLTAAPGDTLWKAFQKLGQNDVGRLVVLEGGRLVGYISLRDVVHLLSVSGLRGDGQR